MRIFDVGCPHSRISRLSSRHFLHFWTIGSIISLAMTVWVSIWILLLYKQPPRSTKHSPLNPSYTETDLSCLWNSLRRIDVEERRYLVDQSLAFGFGWQSLHHGNLSSLDQYSSNFNISLSYQAFYALLFSCKYSKVLHYWPFEPHMSPTWKLSLGLKRSEASSYVSQQANASKLLLWATVRQFVVPHALALEEGWLP